MAMSQSLTKVDDCERQPLFKGYVILISSPFRDGTTPLSSEPFCLLVFECRQPSLFVLSSVQVCGDCLRLFA